MFYVSRCGHDSIADKIIAVLTEQAEGFRRASLETSKGGGRKKFAAYGRKLIQSSQKAKISSIKIGAAAHQMIDAKGRLQRTPLHLAVKNNNLKVVQLLCSK